MKRVNATYIGAWYLHLSGTPRRLQSLQGCSRLHFCFLLWHSVHESKPRFRLLELRLPSGPLSISFSIFEPQNRCGFEGAKTWNENSLLSLKGFKSKYLTALGCTACKSHLGPRSNIRCKSMTNSQQPPRASTTGAKIGVKARTGSTWLGVQYIR